ncbi:hypothetical protein CPB84DRAFT_1796387 [Gymnopilus junonius]|uniref:Uncharacterized protein n=1 Tax=Gymnopilus junonius TaxID=109634 RepID=A0A9P5NAL9_GYMJU|nr:hypothetical protein CPB84DRAFT_1796387 [Gymnopilus junonius]
MAFASCNLTNTSASNNLSSGNFLDNDRRFQHPDITQFWRRLEEMQSWIQALRDSQKRDQEEQERLKELCDMLEQKVLDTEEIRKIEFDEAKRTTKRLQEELEREQKKALGLEEDLKIREMEAFRGFLPRRTRTPDRYPRPRSQYGHY